MRIFAVGDVVGNPGRTVLKENLKSIQEKYKIDFTIVNGENASGGVGIDPRCATEIFDAGANVITLGNHTWRKKNVVKILDDNRVVRPINYLDGTLGTGCRIFNVLGKRIAVLNAVGRIFMDPVSNPYVALKNKIDEIHDEVDIIIVDFHAEATSEKIAMGHFLDGRVNLVYGTHTHVQTADEVIFESGTAYISDVGMTGSQNGVIGTVAEAVIKKFLTSLPQKFDIAEGNEMLNGLELEIDEKTGKTLKIERIKWSMNNESIGS